jgi:N6-adenosine-specific RNA methylase IME4/predicted XRE-type DNA-binding protein
MKLKEHPILSKIIPPLSSDDFQRLKADIEKNGIRLPIIVSPKGKIIDGVHRYKIAKELGIKFEIKEQDFEDEVMAGIQLNLARRHLSIEQKRELIAKLRQMGWSQEKVAETIGIAQSRVSDLSKNTSIIDFDNACIPDLRYKISKEHEEEIFKRYQQGETQEQLAADYGISQQRVSQIITKHLSISQKNKVEVPPPQGKYAVIYLDPPWPVGSIVMEKWESPIEDKYPTMTLEEIEALPIPDLAMDNCALFMWTTHTFLPDALKIIEKWNFKYHCLITWDKGSGWTQFGFNRRTEFLIYAYKGQMIIDQYGEAIPTLISEPKTIHSKKPDSIREMIKNKTPEPRLEMFGRGKAPEGWKFWGLEAG